MVEGGLGTRHLGRRVGKDRWRQRGACSHPHLSQPLLTSCSVPIFSSSPCVLREGPSPVGAQETGLA